jgi:hypothetical protein
MAEEAGVVAEELDVVSVDESEHPEESKITLSRIMGIIHTIIGFFIYL